MLYICNNLDVEIEINMCILSNMEVSDIESYQDVVKLDFRSKEILEVKA